MEYLLDYRECTQRYCPVIKRNVEMTVREYGLNCAPKVQCMCKNHDQCIAEYGTCGNIYKDCRIV